MDSGEAGGVHSLLTHGADGVVGEALWNVGNRVAAAGPDEGLDVDSRGMQASPVRGYRLRSAEIVRMRLSISGVERCLKAESYSAAPWSMAPWPISAASMRTSTICSR